MIEHRDVGGVEWTRIELPDGSRLIYIDEGHSYWLADQDWKRGKRITSVSTLCKPYDFKPDHLMRWAAKRTAQGISDLSNDPEGYGYPDLRWLSSGEDAWGALEDAKLTYNDLRDAAGVTGTTVHSVLEDLGHQRVSPDEIELDDYPEGERGYVQSVSRWWQEVQPHPLNVEQFIFSDTHRYAGRFDLRAEVGDGTYLLDLKTSNFIAPAYHVQLAGYVLAAEECGVGECDGAIILKAHADGRTATEIPGLADAADFVFALNVYRRSNEIARAQRVVST